MKFLGVNRDHGGRVCGMGCWGARLVFFLAFLGGWVEGGVGGRCGRVGGAGWGGCFQRGGGWGYPSFGGGAHDAPVAMHFYGLIRVGVGYQAWGVGGFFGGFWGGTGN